MDWWLFCKYLIWGDSGSPWGFKTRSPSNLMGSCLKRNLQIIFRCELLALDTISHRKRLVFRNIYSFWKRMVDGYHFLRFANILRMIYSPRSMAVFSGRMLSPQSPCHFSALARLYYFACKTAVLRRLPLLRREIRSIVIDLGSTTYKGFKSANFHLHITLLLEIRVSQNLTRLEITSTT